MFVGFALAGTLVTGCGANGAKTPPANSAGATTPAAGSGANALNRSVPTRIVISRIGVSAPIEELGLRPNGQIEEPPLTRPNLAGWYKEGPTPGEIGPAVILGHVDANKKEAVFFRLKELHKGDRVEIRRAAGKSAVFTVERLERVAKTSFPSQKIYAENLGYAGLRLITCGGGFDAKTGHYTDNVIAYARLTG